MKTGFSKKIFVAILLLICGALSLASKPEKESFSDYELAYSHAPEFWFDLEEQFYPCDYSKYYYDQDDQENNPEVAVKMYLDQWKKDKDAEIFYSIDNDNGKTIIRYWLFYVYNDFLNKHYGDAETITIIINSESGEKTVIGSAHIGSLSKIAIANNQITQGIQNQTNILVELGSHANCPDLNGDGYIGARELDNWYNAYGISNWDEYDKKGVKLSRNDYKLIPLTELETELKDKESFSQANDLGFDINFKGDFFGYQFNKTIIIPIGGQSVSLSSIRELKNNPYLTSPLYFGKIFNSITEFMVENYSSKNQYRPDLAEFFDSEDDVPKESIATSTQIKEEKKELKPQEEQKEKVQKEENSELFDKEKDYQRLLQKEKEDKEKIYQMSLMVLDMQKQVEKIAKEKAEEKTKTLKAVKGASTVANQLLISEVSSGVNNADQEYVQIYNSGKEDIDLSQDFALKIMMGSNITKKKIEWIDPIIKAKSFAILADKSLHGEIKINGYYSSGITQNSEILIEYQNSSDKGSWPEPLKTGYCATRDKNDKGYVKFFSITQDCLIKGKKSQQETKTSATKSSNNSTTQGGSPYPTENSQPAIFYPVIINEIMFDPQGKDTDREWIEIYNNSTSSIDLTNWKFFENQTNHGLNLEQGNIALGANQYAVIVQDKTEFLKDYPSYGGTILKASFSLNSNETLAIKNKDLLIDSLEYSSNYGAQDNGYSLQLINGNLIESIPTPGLENLKKYHDLSANFSFSPVNPMVNEKISFNASSSQIFSEIVNFNWTITTTSINSTSSTLDYFFNATGTYEISLTVSNKYFSTSTPATSSIEVLETREATSTATSTQDLIIPEIEKDSVIVNEIMYDPGQGDEWIEIYNQSENDISNIIIQGNKTSDKAEIASIKSKEYIIITAGCCPNATGTMIIKSLTLNNEGERILIKDSNERIIHEFEYDNNHPAIKTTNNSLQLINGILIPACATPGRENRSDFCSHEENQIKYCSTETHSDPTAQMINDLLDDDPPIFPTSSENTLPPENTTSSSQENQTSSDPIII